MWFLTQVFKSPFDLYELLTSLHHHTFLIISFKVNQSSFSCFSHPLNCSTLHRHLKYITSYQRIMCASMDPFHFSPLPTHCYLCALLLSSTILFQIPLPLPSPIFQVTYESDSAIRSSYYSTLPPTPSLRFHLSEAWYYPIRLSITLSTPITLQLFFHAVTS